MAITRVEDVIRQINNKIDGKKLAVVMGYFPERIQISGESVKCFCPLHKEQAFSSLYFDLLERTYQCKMKKCPGHVGGTYVEFWCMLREMEPLEAALDLAEKLKLDIDVEALRGLGAAMLAKAKEELAAGNLAEARTAIDQAIAFDPQSPDLGRLSAQIHDAAGDHDKAVSEYLRIVDACISQQQFVQAHEILDPLIEAEPTSIPVAERQAGLARNESLQLDLASALLRLSDLLRDAGETKREIAALDEVASLELIDAQTLMAAAERHRLTERSDKALAVFGKVSLMLAQEENWTDLCPVMEIQEQLAPEDPKIKEQLAAVLAKVGREEDASKKFYEVADAWKAAGDPDKCREVLKQLLDARPDDALALSRVAELAAEAGDTGDAVAAYRRLSALARGADDQAAAAQYLEQAKSIDPQNLGLRRDLAELQLAGGNLDEAVIELFGIADVCLTEADPSEGFSILERIRELDPSNTGRVLQIARALEGAGFDEKAIETLLELARELQTGEEHESALEICREARRMSPLHDQVLQVSLESVKALGHAEQAVLLCRETSRAFLDTSDLDTAEQWLRRGLEIAEGDPSLKAELARICEQAGRTEEAVGEWLEIALIHSGAERHDEALTSAREVLRLHPENGEAQALVAGSLEALGEVDEALGIWRAAAEALVADDPDSAQALGIYEHILALVPGDLGTLSVIADMSFRIRGADEARPAYEMWIEKAAANDDDLLAARAAAVTAYPEEHPWRQSMADQLADRGDEQGAIHHYEELLQAYRGDEAQADNYGHVLGRLSQLCPEHRELKFELAQSKARAGNVDEATATFSELAQAYLNEGDQERGLSMLQASLEYQPENREILSRVAELLEKLDRPDEALAAYEQLLEISREMDTWRSVVAAIEKVLMLSPERPDLRLELAELYESHGEIELAVEQYYRVVHKRVKSDPTDKSTYALCDKLVSIAPLAHYDSRELLVECALAAGDTNKAKSVLETIGNHALDNGELERGEQAYRKIQEIDPADIASGERLGKLYEVQGRIDDALESYRTVLALYEKHDDTARVCSVLDKLKNLAPKDAELRRRLARTLATIDEEEDRCAAEYYDLIALEVSEGEVADARATMAEAAPLMTGRWDLRYRLIQLFTPVAEQSETLASWEEFLREAVEAGKFQISLEGANVGLEIDPDCVGIREYRVRIHAALEDIDAAEEDLRHLAALKTGLGEHDAAENYLRQALEIRPGSTGLLSLLIESQIAQDHAEDASVTLRELVGIHRETGETEAAVTRARQIVELNPASIEDKDALAALLIESGELDEAMTLWHDVASILIEGGDGEGAITRYEAILEQRDRDIEALRGLADTVRGIHGSGEAAPHYERLLSVAMEDLTPEHARDEFARVLQIEPSNLQVAEKYGDFLYQIGEIDESITQSMSVVRSWRELEEPAEALRVAAILRDRDPSSLEIMEIQAQILETLGEKDQAVSVYKDIASAHQIAGEDRSFAEVISHCADILADQIAPQIDAADAWELAGDLGRSTEFILRGVDLNESAGDPAANIALYQRAMMMNPDDLNLAARLCDVYERTDQIDQAVVLWLDVGERTIADGGSDRGVQIYEHVREIAPSELEPRRRLAALAEAAGDTAAALAEYREMIPIAAQVGDVEEPILLLNKVIELDPTDSGAMVARCDQFRQLGRVDELFDSLAVLLEYHTAMDSAEEAIPVLEEMRQLRPEDIDLSRRSFDLFAATDRVSEAGKLGLRLVETYLEMGDTDQASEMIARVSAIEPGEIRRRTQMGQMAHTHGYGEVSLGVFRDGAAELLALDAAEQSLELCTSGLSLFPDDEPLRRAKVDAHRALGQDSEVVAELLSLARMHDDAGADENVWSVLDEILASYPEDVSTHQAYVDMSMARADNDRAADHLIQLAGIHYGAGDLEKAIEALKEILLFAPDRTELRIRLADLHQENGETEEARSVWIGAAADLQSGGELARAIEVYEKVREFHPHDIQVMAALSECYRESGDDEKYREYAVQLSDIYTETGDTAEASRILDGLTERFPEDAEIWSRLAEAQEALGDVSQATRCHRMLFRIYEADRKFDLARASLERAYVLTPEDVGIIKELGDICLRLNHRPEGMEYLRTAARLQQEAGEYDDAREVIERILKIDPSHLETRRTLGSILESMDNVDDAVSNYSLAAKGWTERREHAEAIDMYEHILALQPDNVAEREAYAHVLEREERTPEACEQYLVLIQAIPEDETDPRQVVRYCRQILKLDPQNVDAHVHLFTTFERTRKPRLALDEARWLADYYISIGEMHTAEDYIKRGLDQAPGEIELRKRLIEILVETDRTGEAARNLSELAETAQSGGDSKTARWALKWASEIVPDSVEYRQQHVRVLEAAGEMADVRQVLAEIMQLHLSAGEMEKARVTGERVMESAPDDMELRQKIAESFEEAGLPEVAAFHFSFMAESALKREDFRDVIRHAEHILRIKPRHIQARECLVQALVSLGETDQACAQSRELYSLYFEAGEFDRAQKSLKLIIQHKPSDPQPRQLLVELYRTTGQAELMVEQLRRLAEIYANEGDISNAVDSLRDLMQQRPDDTRARVRYIDLYSQLGEESELYDDYLHLARIFRKKGAVVEASQVYEKLLQMHPSRTECREQFVEFLFEQGQNNHGVEEAKVLIQLYMDKEQKVEAGRLLEQALGKEPTDTHLRYQRAMLELMTNRRGQALRTLTELLKHYKEERNELEQIKVIEKILEIDDMNVDLREQLADLFLSQGEGEKAREHRIALANQYLSRQLFDLAEAEYRKILAHNRSDVEAWHLAIDTHLKISGDKKAIIPDLEALASVQADTGKLRDAVDTYQKILALDPENINALRSYIEAYSQIGMEEELVDDYLRLATLLSQTGDVDGAMRVYQHLQELAPENEAIRSIVSSAQAGDPPPAPKPKAARKAPAPPPASRTLDPAELGAQLAEEAIEEAEGEAERDEGPGMKSDLKIPSARPADPVAAEMAGQDLSGDGLEKAIGKYESILKLQPNNPNVRAKMAELMSKSGRMKEADAQWTQAANDFLTAGVFDRAIQIFDELVKRHPDDAFLRERLMRAILKRESLNAIGSIIEMPKNS